MAGWPNQKRNSWTNWVGLSVLLLCVSSAGCGRGGQSGDASGDKPTAPAAANSPAAANGATANVIPVALRAKWELSFIEATLQEPPVDEQRPPDKTVAGKAVGKMYDTIVGEGGKGGLWEKVKFVSPAGKPLHYTAIIRTGAGVMELDLWPDIAPNHVRNFVALARAGYYDGLSFDRAVKEMSFNKCSHEYVEAGCPLGTGQAGYGSIGYWLKAELSDKVLHEPGTVGAWHGEEVDSASCKFYITLKRAEDLDGAYTVFGKITRGMDVVRKIYESQQTRDSDGNTLGDGRLERSVLIERVEIHVSEE
jgi:peptidyl-prolyl cis-trans isomerase B (cyclophilin B)